MPTTEMIVTVALVAAVALGFIHLIRLFTTAMKYKAMRKLVEVDPSSATTLLSQLERSDGASNGDDRIAIILVAVGVAMAAGCMIAIDDRGIVRMGIAASLFPLLVGGALWVRHFLIQRARAQREQGQ